MTFSPSDRITESGRHYPPGMVKGDGAAASTPEGSAKHSGIMEGSPPPPDKLVTLANWQDPPFSRWSFQHFRELVPTANINRGVGPIAPFQLSPRNLGAVSFVDAHGSRRSITSMLAETYTDGFLVLHRGRIVTEQYFNHMTPTSHHLLQSISKSVVGTLVGILQNRGCLDTTDLVTEYVPELKSGSFADATVRHLLDMTTGTKFSEDYADLKADVRQYEQVIGWRPQIDPQPASDLYGFVQSVQNQRQHGGLFEYRSILTDALGWVIERASGRRLPELLSSELWMALGAECDAEIALDGHGNPIADGGISMTLRDLARFGQMYLQNGFFNGQQIVPVEWVLGTRQRNDEAVAAFSRSTRAASMPRGQYRNQWWVKEPDEVFMARGIHGQLLYLHVTSELVVVKLSSAPIAFDPLVVETQIRAAEAIAASLA